MPFIVAVLALGLAGSTGWAFFHYVVRFFWPEAGYYAACIAWVLYVCGLIRPSMRRVIRRLLTISLYGCIGYLAWAMYRGGALLLDFEKLGVVAIYCFFVRYLVDRSFERGFRIVLQQLRYEGPVHTRYLMRDIAVIIAITAAIYVCVMTIRGQHPLNASGKWATVITVFFLCPAEVYFAFWLIYDLLDSIGMFFPRETLFRPPPQQNIYDSTRGYALTFQIDAAARGEGSGGDFNPQFED